MEEPINAISNICCTCLSTDRKLIRVCDIDEGVTNLFFLLSCDSDAYEILSNKDPVGIFMCWECKALMYKMCKFRDQACAAQKRLNDYTNGINTTPINNLSMLSKCHQNYEYVSNDKETKLSDQTYRMKFNVAPINNINCEAVDRNDNKGKDTKHKCLKVKDSCEKPASINYTINNRNNNTVVQCKKVCLIKKIVEKNVNYTVIYMTKMEMLESLEKRRSAKSFAEAKFKCDTCIEVYRNELDRKVHIQDAHRIQAKHVKCNICQVYVRETWFYKHRSDHYLKFSCHHCDNVFYNILTMMKHLTVSHAIRNEKNEIRRLKRLSCAKNPGLKPWLADVSPDEGTSRGFVCSQCQEWFETKKKRTYHILKMHNKVQNTCSKCGKSFFSAFNLKIHERTHDESAKEPCPVCGKIIRCDTMKLHMKVHDDREPVSCFECNKTFVCQSAYLRHLKLTKIHAGDDRFRIKCPICMAGFRTKADCRDHVNYRHMARTIHKCHICDKKMSSGRLLKRHIRYLHNGEKKTGTRTVHLCQLCGKECRDSTALRDHEALHGEAKPYRCPQCAGTFRTNGALFAHRKKKHQVVARRQLLKLVDAEVGDIEV